MNNDYIDQVVSMLKKGYSSNDIQQVVKESQKEYPDDFVTFMATILKENKIKKKEIGDITGLSKDYTYKLLNGNKKTKERDYIIAICIASKMNLSQVQHALQIYGMPILSKLDLRDSILMYGFENSMKFYSINDWLEKTRLPYIKVSPDMPTYQRKLLDKEINTNDLFIKPLKEKHVYKEINRETFAEPNGNAPMDYAYSGYIEVEDENKDKYYIQETFAFGQSIYITINEENFNKQEEYQNKLNELYNQDLSEEEINIIENRIYNEFSTKPLECFESLEETINSDFFEFYLKLDKATDDKVRETLSKVDDTKYTETGYRLGWKMIGEDDIRYIESYDNHNVSDQIYFQIVIKNGKTRFTASHKSVFMKLELGEMYKYYFGESEELLYFVDVDSLENLPQYYKNYTFVFREFLNLMLQQFQLIGSPVPNISDEQMEEKNMDLIAQRATISFISGDYNESLVNNLELVNLMNKKQNPTIEDINVLVVTYSKISKIYEILNDYVNKEKYDELILGYYDYFANAERNEDYQAVTSIAEMLIIKAQMAQDDGNFELINEYSKKIISLLENKCFSIDDYIVLYHAYGKLAFNLDDEGKIEEAEEMYEKAYDIVKEQRLQYNDNCKISILTFYNNYAWVLWNKLGSEEAIVLYGRELELLEEFATNGDINQDEIIFMTNKTKDDLEKIYIQTGREKEIKRLERKVNKILNKMK